MRVLNLQGRQRPQLQSDGPRPTRQETRICAKLGLQVIQLRLQLMRELLAISTIRPWREEELRELLFKYLPRASVERTTRRATSSDVDKHPDTGTNSEIFRDLVSLLAKEIDLFEPLKRTLYFFNGNDLFLTADSFRRR